MDIYDAIKPLQISVFRTRGATADFDSIELYVFVGGVVNAGVRSELDTVEKHGLLVLKGAAVMQHFSKSWRTSVSNNIKKLLELDSNMQKSATGSIKRGGADEGGPMEPFGNANANDDDLFSLAEIEDAMATTSPVIPSIRAHVDTDAAASARLKDTKPKARLSLKFVYMDIHSEDTIFEVKQKIAIATGIPIYEQYLTDFNNALHYRLEAPGTIIQPNVKNLLKILYTPNEIDLPIGRTYACRDNLKINALDMFTLISHYYYTYGCSEFALFNINSFCPRTVLNNMKQQEMNMVYWGFVVMYWPMLTRSVFNQWRLSPQEMDIYPDLVINEMTKKRFEAEQKVMRRLWSPRPVTLKTPIGIAITYAILNVRYALSTNINIRNLFDLFALDSMVTACRCVIGRESSQRGILGASTPLSQRPLMFDKTYQYETPIIDHIPGDTIMFRIRLRPMPFRGQVRDLDYESIDSFNVLFLQNGNYRILSHWRQEDTYGFAEIFHRTKQAVDQLITRINAIGKQALQLPIEKMTKENTTFLEFIASLNYNRVLSEAQYAYLRHIVNDYVAGGIMEPIPSEQTHRSMDLYWFYKGMHKSDSSRINRTFITNNTYGILTETGLRERYIRNFVQSHSLKIHHHYGDVRFEIRNVRQDEFDIVRRFIDSIMATFERGIGALDATEEVSKIERTMAAMPTGRLTVPGNYIQYLKAFDPKLYDYTRHKSLQSYVRSIETIAPTMRGRFQKEKEDKIKENAIARLYENTYSKLCQKRYQPLVVNPEMYRKLSDDDKKRVVKYWNFTSNSPALYICPNRRLPHMRFIVHKHPLNYCLPCCKKLDMTIPKQNLSKEEHTRRRTEQQTIQNTCKETYRYDKPKAFSATRYVSAYGRRSSAGRIMAVPYQLETLLKQTVQTASDHLCKDNLNYYICGIEQLLPCGIKCGVANCMAHAMDISVVKLCKMIVEMVKNTRKFEELLNGEITIYFPTKAHLFDTLMYLGNPDLIPDMSPNIPWDRLFLNFAELMHINVVFLIDSSGTNEAGISIEIPAGINCVDDILIPNQPTIIMLKKHNVNTIYWLDPAQYHSERVIETRIFTNTDQCVNIIRNMIKIMLKTKDTRLLLLANVQAFCTDYTCAISQLHADQNRCVFMTIKYDTLEPRHVKGTRDWLLASDKFKHSLCIPLHPTAYKRFQSMKSLVHHGAPAVQNQSADQVNDFITAWNAWGKREPLKPDMYVETVSMTEASAPMGLKIDGLVFHFNKNESKLFEDLPRYTFLYGYERIYSAIENAKQTMIKPLETNTVRRTMYNMMLYRLLLLEFKQYFDSDVNKPLRARLLKMISNLWSEETRIDTEQFMERVKATIVSSRDHWLLLSLIRDHIDDPSPKEAIHTFNNTKFDFDHMQLDEIRRKGAPLGALTKIAKSITIPDAGGELDNVFAACGAEAGRHCKKGRLVIPKNRLEPLLARLADDLVNPYKEHLFDDLHQNILYYNFIQRTNEHIFVTV